MNFSFCDVNIGWNLSDHIKQRVNLDSSLRLSKECPLKQAQAEINGGGIECVELSTQDKLPIKSLALSKVDHVVGKLFGYPVISVGVGIRHIAELDVPVAKSEAITIFIDGIDDADYLSEAVAFILLYDSIRDSLWQKLNELTAKIFSVIHAVLDFIQTAKSLDTCENNHRNIWKSHRMPVNWNYLYINQ